MQLTQSPSLPSKALFLAAIVGAASAFTTGPSLAVHSLTNIKTESMIFMARSESFKRTNDRERRGRGGPQEYGNGGQDYDYSGGNLKYGTGKYTQRGNDGYQGGVNISKNGRSMQDAVYREDRRNMDMANGRNRHEGFAGNRMDEIEDLERGMGGAGRPLEGMRDRMMRNRGGRGGGMMRGANDMYDMEDMHHGSRDRMGGGGLLRDMQGDRGGSESYGDFGSPAKIMGGSSHGRGGGYRSSQFESGLSNERRRNEEFGFRMEDYFDERDGGMMNFGGGSQGRRRGGASNFDRMMGRGGGRDDFDEFDEDFHYEQEGRHGGRRGDRRDHFEGGRGDYGDDYGRERGSGGLLRDSMRP